MRPLPRDSWLVSPDAAASEVIGSILTAALTIGMAVTLGQFAVDLLPAEKPPAPTSLQAAVNPGEGGWGTGDETLSLSHTGGAPLPQNDTTIRVRQGALEHDFSHENISFPEGHLALGDRWNTTLSVPANTTLEVSIMRHTPSTKIIATASPQSGPEDCSQDTHPPSVSTWTRRPAVLAYPFESSLEITATLQDDCSGPDRQTAPHLWYRLLNDSFPVDAGSMENFGGDTWKGEIPEPDDGWPEEETLIYYLSPLQDHAGNKAQSQNQTATIEPEPLAEGILTYVTAYHAFSGSVEDFSALQNATNGDAATLKEESTEPNVTTSEAYGTAHSSSPGTTDPGDATGSPDGNHALLGGNKEWVGIEGFQTFAGDINAVDIAVQGHYEGTPGPEGDALELSYRVGTTRGSTTAIYDTDDIPEGEDGAATYLNVTDDRDWVWSDLAELQVRSAYTQQGSPDDLEYHVNALWLRVAYENPAYNMSIRMDVDDLPSGDHEIELLYAVSDEVHHVEAWNYTATRWDPMSPSLARTTSDTWTAPLHSTQTEDGTALFRLVDEGPDHRESTVDLEYAGVRTR